MCAPEDKIGIITEQGDLGLGFDPISDEDQEKIEENHEGKEGKKKVNH